MKRSELVTRIEEYLLHTQHLNVPCSLGSDFKAAAEELVVLIEQAGMRPPKERVVKNYISHTHTYITESWETEE